MKLFKTLTLLFITSQVGFAQETETLCDDFSSELWESVAEGDTIGYSTDGTEPILGPAWFSSGTGYTFGTITFNFNGAEQTAVIDIKDSWGWGTHDLTINGTTMVSLAESFPMVVDGFSIDLTRDTLPSGLIEIELTIEGTLTSISLDGAESWISKLCVTRPVFPDITASLNGHESTELALYPNPASNDIQLITKKPISAYSIHSISGKLISTQTFASVSQKNVDISDLESGLYLITIKTTENKQKTVRFTKQ